MQFLCYPLLHVSKLQERATRTVEDQDVLGFFMDVSIKRLIYSNYKQTSGFSIHIGVGYA